MEKAGPRVHRLLLSIPHNHLRQLRVLFLCGRHWRCYTAAEVKPQQSKSEGLLHPHVSGDRKHRSRITICAVLTLATLVLLGVAVRHGYERWRTPTRDVPAPTDLEKLDPQLRDYLRRQLKWVQQKPIDSNRQATLGIVYAANSLWAEARRCFSNVIQVN